MTRSWYKGPPADALPEIGYEPKAPNCKCGDAMIVAMTDGLMTLWRCPVCQRVLLANYKHRAYGWYSPETLPAPTGRSQGEKPEKGEG